MDLHLSSVERGVVRASDVQPLNALEILRIDRPYWRKTPDCAGVYLLIGDREGRPTVYVGMSTTSMRSRVASHHVNGAKDWFGTLYAIPLEINYVQPIEAELIKVFTDASHAEVANLTPEAKWAGTADPGARAIRDHILAYLEVLIGSDIVRGTDDLEHLTGADAKAKRTWTEQEWLDWVDRDGPDGARRAAEECLSRWRSQGRRIEFGAGQTAAAVFPVCDAGGNSYWLFAIYATKIDLHLGSLARRPVTDDEDLRRSLIERLNAIDGIDLDPEKHAGRPAIPIGPLVDPHTREQLLAAEEWLMDLVQTAAAAD